MTKTTAKPMTARRPAQARYEEVLSRILRAPDPAAALAVACADPGLPPALRRALRAADPDGVALSALLVARLRFERLVRGSPEAEAWFERDPAGFGEAFRRYHAEVPPRAFFPATEAALFQEWQAGQAGRCP